MGRLLLLSMFFVSLSIQAQDSAAGCPTISVVQQDFCDFFVIEGTDSVGQPRIKDLQANGQGEDVYWYLDPQGGEPLDNELLLSDGAIYYAGYNDGSCESRSFVIVTLNLSPVAGRTSTVYVCSDSEPVEIYSLFPPLDDGRTADPGGNVNPALEGGGSLFDPRKDTGGWYVYTKSNSCGTDNASINIKIVQGPYAGESGEAYFELDDEPKDLTDFLGSETNEGGKWTPELEGGVFDPEVNVAGIYTYTVTGDRGCTASATIEVTLNTTSSTLCHNGQNMLVNNNAVNGHLKHGDYRGSCEEASAKAAKTVVSPNPSPGNFNFSNNASEIQMVRILNFNGGVEKEFQANGDPNLLEINLGQLKKGIYFAEVFTTNGKEVIRLVKK